MCNCKIDPTATYNEKYLLVLAVKYVLLIIFEKYVRVGPTFPHFSIFQIFKIFNEIVNSTATTAILS